MSRAIPPATAAVAIVAFCALGVLSSCVGRGKYLESLLVQEAAKSEAASAKTDLDDVTRRYEGLAAELEALRAAAERERREAYTQQADKLSERQELLRERMLQGLVIDSLRREREALTSQRASALAVVTRREEQLAGLRDRVVARSGNFLPGQFELETRDGTLVLSVDEAAIFGERRGARVSDFGDASLANLAGALGGRPDILVDVVCLPRERDGSAAAREEAARRAALVASNLVIGHGMLPEVVRAVGLQVDAGTASVAGLVEEASRRRMQIVVRVPGDGLGAVGRALEE